jgi:pimeloyl-ACP methyl ester carboxylesterase
VEAFTDAGIATATIDRRGNGQSTGARNMDVEVLGRDAVAVCEAVRAHPDVDSRRTGLWGYSNGAWVGGRAAQLLGDPAFLVLTGASAVTQGVSEAYRRTRELRERGVPEPTLAAVERIWTIVFGYMSGEPWAPHWDAEILALRAIIDADTVIPTLEPTALVRSDPRFDPVPRFDVFPLTDPRKNLVGLAPEMGYDPLPALTSLRCPVLVVLAEDDEALPMALSLPRFEQLAAARGDGSFRIEVIPGADHTFGSESYRAATDRFTAHRLRTALDFVPGYLELMANWMRAVCAGA